jgi:hypothetical protein
LHGRGDLHYSKIGRVPKHCGTNMMLPV